MNPYLANRSPRHDNASHVKTLAYTSRLIQPDIQPTLRDIECVSQSHNAGAGITGALAFSGGRFVQILEGDEDEIDALYGRIQEDPRHTDVRLIAVRDNAPREFPDWSMRVFDFETDSRLKTQHMLDIAQELNALEEPIAKLLNWFRTLARVAS